jgi:hypothetical protein
MAVPILVVKNHYRPLDGPPHPFASRSKNLDAGMGGEQIHLRMHKCYPYLRLDDFVKEHECDPYETINVY